MIDLLLIFTLGFLGSFGHCAGMCGPLTVAFSLSQQPGNRSYSSLQFHLLLNCGRICSYALVGATLGGLGSALIATVQLAGIGSELRQIIAILTGLLLMWWGLHHINPNFLPRIPIIHPLQGKWHENLSRGMNQLSRQNKFLTPALLGGVWGLIPCGFLYTAQIKAAQSANLWQGAAMMLAFGLGTMPILLGVGISASRLSADRRSQLFRLGGWVTLVIGVLTLVRTDAMIDYTGHGALLLLMLALLARSVSGFWAAPLQYRRAIGVSSFVLAVAHTAHMLDHSLNWNWGAMQFMLPQHQLGIWTGIGALLLMFPAAITSSDFMQKFWGKTWRKIHLLTVPALILAAIHTILTGSHYFGELNWDWQNQLWAAVVAVMTLGILLARIMLALRTKQR